MFCGRQRRAALSSPWAAFSPMSFSDSNTPGFMSVKPYLLMLCLLTPLFGHAEEKTIYGLTEHVSLPDFDLDVQGKLDTGAQTASLSARDIERFKRKGKNWVRFYLAIDEAHSHPIELPVKRISKIKRRAGDIDSDDEKTYTPRPVVELELCMGKAKRSIEVNLTDRSAFQYPLLIGSDALTRFGALVDPSLNYAAGKPGCITDSDADE
jgi:hypothetical protein